MTTKTIPTVPQIQADWAEFRSIFDGWNLIHEATIEDYPIGGANRGQCKLSYEFHPKKGYRTVRTTTDRYGNWCKPKCSTYQDHPICVVDTHDGDRRYFWLRLDTWSGPYLQAANGDNLILHRPPCTSRPRREDHHYTIACNGAAEKKVLSADPPELCDAWEAWIEGYKELYDELRKFTVPA